MDLEVAAGVVSAAEVQEEDGNLFFTANHNSIKGGFHGEKW